MKTVEQLLEEAQDPRLERAPKYARDLIHVLAHRLKLEYVGARGVRKRAEKEVAEARALLTSGPEDSDTFLGLPRSVLADPDDEGQRPLGKGMWVEFRSPSASVGEGIWVRLHEDRLEVRGPGQLLVEPHGHDHLYIS